VNDKEEFEEEARQVTREFKLGVMDPSRDVAKYEQQMRYKRRKELLRKNFNA